MQFLDYRVAPNQVTAQDITSIISSVVGVVIIVAVLGLASSILLSLKPLDNKH